MEAQSLLKQLQAANSAKSSAVSQFFKVQGVAKAKIDANQAIEDKDKALGSLLTPALETINKRRKVCTKLAKLYLKQIDVLGPRIADTRKILKTYDKKGKDSKEQKAQLASELLVEADKIYKKMVSDKRQLEYMN